jgi:hypothetical protein
MKNIREITQICNSHSYDTGSSALTALCDDSTVWQFVREHWKLVPPIPQVDIEPEQEPEVIDNDDF